MDKWFKLSKEGYAYKKLPGDPKANGQLFVAEIKRVGNIERIGGNLLDFDETRKKLMPEKVEFESCFEIKPMTQEDIENYRKKTNGI